MKTIKRYFLKAVWLYKEKNIVAFLRDLKLFLYYQITKYPRYLFYKLKYKDVAPTPQKIIYINPSDIEYIQRKPFHRYMYPKGSYILDGEWDVKLINKERKDGCKHFKKGEHGLVLLEKYDLYIAIKKHFLKGVPWEETEYYEKKASRYNSKDSIQKFESKLKGIDRLYESIKSHGYLSQSKIHENPNKYAPSVYWNENNSGEIARTEPKYREVMVNIGRDGKIIFDEGRHRLCTAKVLEIDKIPVRVLVRHKKWQELRKEVANAESLDELSEKALKHLNHPDMEDLKKDI